MKRIRIIASAVALMATLAVGAQNISNCWNARLMVASCMQDR